jgi:archaeal type IV pilus assembly protein PilA
MNTTTLKPKELKSNHRAVAPVIATLLMVAIAVVGGTIIFVFSQGFFSSSQISGVPTIEALKVLGYDARDATALQAHDGAGMSPASAGLQDGAKQADERVAIYLKNDSVQKVSIAELRFAGAIYNFTSQATLDGYAGSAPARGEYAVLTDTPGSLLTASAGEIQPGEIVTIVVDLDENIKIGRDSQFKMTTTNGAVVVHTVNIGQQSG